MTIQSIYDGAPRRPAGMTPIASVSRHDDRIAIGPVLPEDIGALYLWFNDFEAAKFDFPYVPVDGVAFRAWVEKQANAEGEYLFAIRKLHEQPALGYVLLRGVHPIHRSAELGIRIGHEADRGKGDGTRAVRLATDYAFDTLNLNRISLTVRSDNGRAVAAYSGVGFRQEGVLRQASYLNGGFVDMTVMALLRDDRTPTAPGNPVHGATV